MSQPSVNQPPPGLQLGAPPTPVALTVGAIVGRVIFGGILGFLVGLAGSLVQRTTFWGIPFGLVGALLMLAAVVLATGFAVGSRWATLAPAAGWLVALMALVSRRAEGDRVLAFDHVNPYFEPSDQAWVTLALFVMIVAAMVPYRKLCEWARVLPASGSGTVRQVE